MTQTELDESTGKGFETLGAPLCTGVIRAVIITTEGHVEDIQLPFWRGNRAQEAFDTGQATVGIGPPIYRPDLCERVLYKRVVTGRVAYSRKDVEARRASRQSAAKEAEYVESAPAKAAQLTEDDVYECLLDLAKTRKAGRLVRLTEKEYRERVEEQLRKRLPPGRKRLADKRLWDPAWKRLPSEYKLKLGEHSLLNAESVEANER
jgi:hypothetical protein